MYHSLGLYRRLTQASTTSGAFLILAIDHRHSLLSELKKYHPDADHSDLTRFKWSVTRTLAPYFSALLTDPDYGLPAVASGIVPGGVGLIAPLEVTDYRPHPSKRITQLIPDWDVRKLSHAGCQGAKLRLYFHPDASTAQDQTDLAEEILSVCRAEGVPLFLEPIIYSLDPQLPLSPDERQDLIIETARHFSRRTDVLKIEFPVDTYHTPDEYAWIEPLERLNAACGLTPWTLLSRGTPYEIFMAQATAACRAGASGVMVGRALWAEAIALDGDARDAWLREVGVARATQLVRTLAPMVKSWMKRQDAPPMPEGWYKEDGLLASMN